MWDALFGKNKGQYDAEYNKAIKDTKQARAESVYQNRYDKALYDANKDYFDKMGVKDPSASYWNDNGQRTNALIDTNNQYNKYISQLEDERAEVAKKNKYNDFGDGILPSIFALNAWNQYLDMVGDFGDVLQKAGKNVKRGDYSVDPTAEWEKRDHLSDFGATVEAGMSLVPFVSAGAGAGAGVAKTAANSLGKSMLKGAGVGAAYGGIGNLSSYLQQNGKDSSVGGALGSTALGATVGGAVGAGSAGIGYGIGKVGDKLSNVAKNNRTTATTANVVSNLYDDMGNPIAKNGVSYQDALKKAGLDQMNNPADYQAISNILNGGSIPEDWANNPSRVQSLTNKINTFVKELGGKTNTPRKPGVDVYSGNRLQSLYDALDRIKTIPRGTTTTPVTTYTTTGLSNTRLGQIKQGIGDLIKDIPNTTKNVTSKVQNSNIGTNVANLLKTKKGKLLFGGSAGLTLAGLMKNRNDNTGQPSDEEMQELYNYVYGGQ